VSFYERFELLELVRDDGIKTFAARESVSGRRKAGRRLANLDRLTEAERLFSTTAHFGIGCLALAGDGCHLASFFPGEVSSLARARFVLT